MIKYCKLFLMKLFFSLPDGTIDTVVVDGPLWGSG